MKRAIFLLAAVLTLVVPGVTSGAESLQKIRIGFPSLAFSYMPFYVAKEKGLLKQYGLEAEYIQMRTSIQPQALINGNINFFPSVSTGISAGIAGLPVVVVLNFCDGSPWMLVTQRDINKPQDLIGKDDRRQVQSECDRGRANLHHPGQTAQQRRSTQPESRARLRGSAAPGTADRVGLRPAEIDGLLNVARWPVI